jgi:hypothetical protein
MAPRIPVAPAAISGEDRRGWVVVVVDLSELPAWRESDHPGVEAFADERCGADDQQTADGADDWLRNAHVALAWTLSDHEPHAVFKPQRA